MKKIISFLSVFTLLFGMYTPALALAPEGPAVNAKAAVLMEKETGNVLYENNAHTPLPPASVTKVMSLLLVGEAINQGKIQLTDMVTASEYAASMGGSQIYLEPGEQMSIDDMVKSVVVSSANDAVVALGEHIAGSEAAFVTMMNNKAKELGMNDTTFKNACGLDAEGHVTSAYDIAVMSRELLITWPEIKNYTTIWMDSVRNGAFQLANTNKLVKTYTGATGLKTGYTSISGHCLSATAERDGMELITAILCAPSSADRFSAAKSLLDYGFANYALCDVYPDGDLSPVQVVLGKRDGVQPEITGGNKILLEKSLQNSIERQLDIAERVDAPVAEGQTLGEMIVTAGGKEILRVPVVAGEAVEKLGFFDVYSRLLRRLFMGS
jgi:D-alanyl-D-alanine carboxypeptidase (penicillin-binding protein 5/6)